MANGDRKFQQLDLSTNSRSPRAFDTLLLGFPGEAGRVRKPSARFSV